MRLPPLVASMLLPIMGLKKGMFSQDANPILRFRLDNSWQLDRIVH